MFDKQEEKAVFNSPWDPSVAILFYLNAAFNLWMLVDAARRRMDFWWYLIILMPLGEWVYFFAVKIHDYDLSNIKKMLALDRSPSVTQLRRDAEETPSIENRLRFANGLLEAAKYEEATDVYEQILAQDDEEIDALYGLAHCRLAREETHAAAVALGMVIELDPSFKDWEAWFDLAYANWQLNKRDEAIAVLRRLVEKTPRIKHKAILGKYLARDEQNEAAREVLEEAIREYQHAHGFVKRTAGRWASDARATLRKL